MKKSQIKNGIVGLWESFLFAFARVRPPEKLEDFSPAKALVFGYMGVGDLLMIRPALEAFKQKYPHCEITLLTGPYSSAKQLATVLSVIDRVEEIDWRNSIGEKRKSALQLIRQQNFDVLLANYTAPIRFFMPALRQIQMRIGAVRVAPFPPEWRPGLFAFFWYFKFLLFQEEWFRRVVFNFPVPTPLGGEHEIEKGFNLVKCLGVEEKNNTYVKLSLPEETHNSVLDLLKSVGLTSSDFIVSFHVGASLGQRWKMWPIDKFESLMDRVVKEWDVHVILVGTKEEEKMLSPRILDHSSGRIHRFQREPSVLEVAGLIYRSHLFIGGDSGPGHLSLAVGTATCRLFGPTDSEGYGVWAPGQHVDVALPLACRPCMASGLEKPGVLSFSHCPHINCLNQLDVDTVYSTVGSMLEKLHCKKTSL